MPATSRWNLIQRLKG